MEGIGVSWADLLEQCTSSEQSQLLVVDLHEDAKSEGSGVSHIPATPNRPLSERRSPPCFQNPKWVRVDDVVDPGEPCKPL
jgi:hypothetical protein